MANNDVKAWIEKQVQPKGKASPPLNPLRAAFRLSVMSLVRTRLSARLAEETMTGAFLGATAASVRICADAYSAPASPACTWVQYAKSGSTVKSETVSGADFALLLRLGKNRARLAIFQAKRKLWGTSTLDLGQSKQDKAKKSGEEQFDRLLDYGKVVLKKGFDKDAKLSDLSWIHYLLYHPEELNCCAISELKELEKTSLTLDSGVMEKNDSSTDAEPPTRDMTVNFEGKSLASLISVLDRGAMEVPVGAAKVPHVDGWLAIESEKQLEAVFKQLIDRIDIYYAEEKSGPSYEPNPRSRLGARRQPNVDVFASLFNADGSFALPLFARAKDENEFNHTHETEFSDDPISEPSIKAAKTSDEETEVKPTSGNEHIPEPSVQVAKPSDDENTVQVETRRKTIVLPTPGKKGRFGSH